MGVGDAGSADELPVRPTEHTSGWTFNWTGLLAVVLIVVGAFVVWRWLGDASLGSDAEGAPDESGQDLSAAPTNSVEATRTTPPRSQPQTTTGPPPTTGPPATSTTVPTARQVSIRGEMKSSRFGANCLVAGFTITGFDPHPGRFVCIYPNSRRDFSFNNNGVDEACITADAGDTITIEVDGVRSATISEENLDGE